MQEAAWFVGRKRQQAETDNQVLRNLELSIALYKQIIDDLKDEIDVETWDTTGASANGQLDYMTIEIRVYN